MPNTIVLAVGLDWWLLEQHGAAWKSAGFIVVWTASINDAIDCLKAGVFDLVMLGQSIPAETREKLAVLVRGIGANVPAACVPGSPGHLDSIANAAFERDSTDLLAGMRELLRSKASMRTAQAMLNPTSSEVSAAH
jgi:hypothetical protein